MARKMNSESSDDSNDSDEFKDDFLSTAEWFDKRESRRKEERWKRFQEEKQQFLKRQKEQGEECC